MQQLDITEQDILELTAKYRSEFKHLKKLIDEFEKLAKEDDDREWSEDVDLFRTQLTSNQVSFRWFSLFNSIVL